MTTIRLAAPLQVDSIVNGEGLRTVIWTQGCRRACPSCHNPKTWNEDGGTVVEVDEIKKQLKKVKLQSGVTFCGGEPFLQSKPLIEIAKFVHELGMNVWSFSGYTYEELLKEEDKKELLKHLDVLVDGAFVLAKKDLTLRFRGSSNQRILHLKNGKIDWIEND
ncbi:MAG: anaerobic ribonucleoside-triphosphate reductase activating protein [Pseudomonadales bacterium]|jgi:anaerobic ribonucleoside-triphosphate reductase activating protein|nr:anaerobic ribonucleoside-triphosphate reductase activating protein [Pseudomonadales bacterium]